MYDRTDLQRMFLPLGQMLQIDRALKIEGDRVTCEMDLGAHWVFPMHFPSDPIFPGSLLIEAAGQTIATWAWHEGLRGKPRMTKVSARFEHPVLPSHPKIAFHAVVHRRRFVCNGTVEIYAEGGKVGTVEMMVIVLPPNSQS